MLRGLTLLSTPVASLTAKELAPAAAIMSQVGVRHVSDGVPKRWRLPAMKRFEEPDLKIRSKEAEAEELSKKKKLKNDKGRTQLEFSDSYEATAKSESVLNEFLSEVDSNMYLRVRDNQNNRPEPTPSGSSYDFGRWDTAAANGQEQGHQHHEGEIAGTQRERERQLLQNDEARLQEMWPSDEMDWSERAALTGGQPKKMGAQDLIQPGEPLWVSDSDDSDEDSEMEMAEEDAHPLLHMSMLRQPITEKPPAVERAKGGCPICNMRRDQLVFANSNLLAQFVSNAGRILPRRVNRTCAKHQRLLARTIKVARNLGYMSYNENWPVTREIKRGGEEEWSNLDYDSDDNEYRGNLEDEREEAYGSTSRHF